MNSSYLNRPLTENHRKEKIREENITHITDFADFQERLIRNFITYVKQTGDCNYLSLLNANKLEPNNDKQIKISQGDKILEKIKQSSIDKTSELNQKTDLEISQQEQKNQLFIDKTSELNQKTDLEISQQEQILKTIDTHITEICLNLKDIIKQLAETLHPTNNSENIRNLLEDITKPRQNIYLITALKEEHKKLARFLDLIIAIAQEKDPQNLQQILRDLTYYAEYIKHHAQPTKIQHDLSQIADSFLYLRRLNQYLDLMPETVINLIDIMENTCQ